MKQEETKNMPLPKAFVSKMKHLLGDEAEDFFASYQEERRYGLRLNPLKYSDLSPAYVNGLTKIPWAAEGYYYQETLRPGKHPFHEAGLYYIQEPSAMAVVEALAPQPGERILDLCAAPGGKSTHASGKMAQQGLLVCNEIHPTRAKILSQNIERMGIANAVVLNMAPADLVPHFEGFFDGIIVDAPCSGEGMFRKDADAVGEWSPEHVTLCAERQDGILASAAKMVRPGGRIVYSTCTFSPEENEQTILRFLIGHPEFRLVRPAGAGFFSSGRQEWTDSKNADTIRSELDKTIRIWPHKVDGEGHFLALMIREGDADRPAEAEVKAERKGKRQPIFDISIFEDFCRENLLDATRMTDGRRPLMFGDNLYLIPELMPDLAGLKVLRPGLQVGTLKKDRMEPAHALALFLKPQEVLRVVEIGAGDIAERYLRGEAIEEGREAGWTLITTGGYSLGWAKCANGILKNHYPKGLRRN